MAFLKISGLNIAILLCFLLSSGLKVYSLSYDYSFTHECLESPLKPQYGGGILENPEMNEGVKGWSLFGGNGKLAQRKSQDGNNFIVTFNRNASHQSLSQKFDLKKGMRYTISAWLRVSDGKTPVAAVLKTNTGYQPVGSTIARSGCWSMLKGGLTANASGPAQLYFHSHHPTVDLWADSISVQPFKEEEWRTHQTESLEKVRKSRVTLQALDAQGRPLANANVSVKQLRANFPLGVALSSFFINSTAYQEWFTSRFKYAVFENEMKWVTTEPNQGQEDYSVPDAMVKIIKDHGIQLRGHNILWDEPWNNPGWVQGLSGDQLQQACDKRVKSIVNRYKDQVIHWDVVNENMHNAFLENNLHNPAASANFYKESNQLDGGPIPFLNEFNTIEDPNDQKASPAAYIQKISEMRSQGYSGPLGIGLQGHFNNPDVAYIRSGIDSLASQNLPIWITELDVKGGPNQASGLEQALRELISQPKVEGILMWVAIRNGGCFTMCLTDQNFKNLPTGDVVDKILGEIKHEGLVGVTDDNGVFSASLFHGEYDFHFSHANAVESVVVGGFKVAPTTENKRVVKVWKFTGYHMDYSFTHECLETPLKPQYGGGIIENPEMNDGVKEWSLFGGDDANLAESKSQDGNNFLVTFNRNSSHQSLSQKFYLKKGMLYTISAWLRVSDGETPVVAALKTINGYERVGSTIARSGCWSMLKGGLTANYSGPAQLYFHSHHPTVDLWADSISVQPFTEEEWRTHQTESLEKVRKSRVRFQAVDANGRPLANANVSVKLLRANFPFGVAINDFFLNSKAYQNWFSSRFKFAVFENEMKWIINEPTPGQENYMAADAMLKIMKQLGVQIRGHNILWSEQDRNPGWVQSLSGVQLQQACDRRVRSIVNRYKGQVIHWDVVNENIHNAFLETNLKSPAASANFYKEVNLLDNRPIPFLNEYNVIEDRNDQKASPAAYIKRISEMRSQGYGGPLGIGVQGHFTTPDMAYIRAGIDSLASQKLPIWITELDARNGPNQAVALEQAIRELISLPAINGMIMWAAFRPTGCATMCLTDANFKNLPTGDVVDKILKELKPEGLIGVTDADGYFNASLFHGEYDFHFSHEKAVDYSMVRGVKVAPATENRELVKVMLSTI